MRRITSRFVLLIGTAAVLPLVVYGFVSITSLRNGTGTSVREGNRRVAEQVAEQVTMYMQHNTRVLQSVGSELSATALNNWQQERILKDYVLSFPEIREITLFDADRMSCLVVASWSYCPATSHRSSGPGKYCSNTSLPWRTMTTA